MSTSAIATGDSTVDLERPLREIFAERDKCVRRGDYELLGKVITVVRETGLIDYGKDGPALAVLTKDAGDNAGELVLLGGWHGFPDHAELLKDLCDACRAKCTDCDGTGQRLCTICGGSGELVTSWKRCPGSDESTGTCRRDCESCGGRGSVPDQAKECPHCHGAKVAKCDRCEGSGKMPTGYAGGRTVATAELCPECAGNGRKRKITPQPWDTFQSGELEGYTVLGPITGMLLADLPGDGSGFSGIAFTPDDDGNLAALLVRDPRLIGSGMYLMGGRAEIARR